MTRKVLTLGGDGALALRLPSGETKPLIRVGRAYEYLLLDRSGSMCGQKFVQTRLGMADHAGVAIAQGYDVGLIAFGDTSTLISAPVDNVEQFQKAADTVQLELGTTLAPALRRATQELEGKSGTRVIAVFTDGEVYDPAEALEAGRRAALLGIHILTIGTEDANMDFLARLQTTGTLIVPNAGSLRAGIADAAKFLPAPRRGAK